MNRLLQTALLCSGFLLVPIGYSVVGAQAQTAITPAPDPVVGTAPAEPSGAQDTYDEVAIGQLMKIVELSKLIGGGISQLFSEIQTQTQAVQTISNAQVGPKTLPLHNDPNEVLAREGGPGLQEMSTAVLNGAPIGPQALLDALTTFRANYNLDKAFALKDDTSASNAMAAQAAAQGAVAASTAEDSYKRAEASMTRLNDYIIALQNSADLKTSLDINTRVMVELTQQLNESLRTQATIASMAGTRFMLEGGEAGQDDGLDALDNFNR
jgi:hypothetical protein